MNFDPSRSWGQVLNYQILMDVMGRAGLEAVLLLSAKGLTGAPHPGKRGGEVRRHGSQGGKGDPD